MILVNAFGAGKASLSHFKVLERRGGHSYCEVRIETGRTQVSSTVDETAVQNLPVNGRNWMDLTLLTPGALAQAVEAYEKTGDNIVVVEPAPQGEAILVPRGSPIQSVAELKGNLFEALKFRYFGPVDGHDVQHLRPPDARPAG